MSIFGKVLQPRNEGETIRTSQELDQWARSGAGVKTWSGMNVGPAEALAQTTVFAAIRVIAEGVSMLPDHVKIREEIEGRTHKRNAFEQDIYPILTEQPNEWMDIGQLWEMLLGHAVLRGNGYAFINRVGGRVLELIPLLSHRVKPLLDNKFILTYIYTAPDGERIVLQPADVLHVHGVGSDGIQGYSVISLMRETVGSARAAQRHGANVFANSANPSGVLSTDGALSQGAIDRMKKQFDEEYTGQNSASTLVLEDGLKWSQVSMSSDDAQLLESRKFERSELATWFRVPPHMVGDLERSIQSNIEQQARDLVTHTLQPWITRLERAVNSRILTPINPNLFYKVQVKGLLRGNTKDLGEWYRTMVELGVMTRNEVRELEDLNPLDGLDDPLTPMNMKDGDDDEANDGEGDGED